MSNARKQAREAIAKVAFDVVEGGPMMFIADPDIPLLMAELQIRALIELGWAPPAEAPEPTQHQCEEWQMFTELGGRRHCRACGEHEKTPAPQHFKVENHNTDPVCACGWTPPSGLTMRAAHAAVADHVCTENNR